jgi:poly-gamma-glutamate synthesis protein (capsule biosynthesis protein)
VVAAPRPTVRIVLAGDVMLGRGLRRIVANDPDGVFEDIRFMLSNADITGANMESPLTNRPHIATNPYALEAPPETAAILASAGFDLLSIANNHAGDAGRASVMDTVEAIEVAGMQEIGGGVNSESAARPVVLDQEGLRIGFLSYDATGAGTTATETRPGITRWNEERAHLAVIALRSEVDVLIVAVHGGVEYRTWTDPYMASIAQKLHVWGVDVMWGTGPHVVQPVYVIDGDRPTVVATSLGNLIFDQGDSDTKIGAVLEVLADAGGAAAYRVAMVDHHDRRVHFDEWEVPTGNAAMVGEEWWSLARSFQLVGTDDVGDIDGFRYGEVVDASRGDVDSDGRDEIVVAFSRPFQENPVNLLFPNQPWMDATGQSAHLGVFQSNDLRPEWIAGTLFRPVKRVVACDGSLAVEYVADDGTPASGGWRWRGFGFTVTSMLDRDATLGCADIDGDGATDPVLGVP